MTDAELQAIRERCEKATFGPWFMDGHEVFENQYGKGYTIAIVNARNHWVEESLGNANFIANSRNDIPGLLKEIDLLRFAIRCRHQPDQEYISPQREIERLQVIIRAQAERIAQQSELLSRKAEKQTTS